jgi:hypothetical protein
MTVGDIIRFFKQMDDDLKQGEQPQEWTPEYVEKQFYGVDFARPSPKQIADAHNAALAAEREVSLGLIKNLHDCEQQLAAEREKRKLLVDAIESYLAKQRVQILKEALAKEGK